MKVLIHDLDAEQEKLFREKYDVIFRADGKYAGCQGCFSCWTKSPAECFIKDRLSEAARAVGQADTLVLITRNCYGMYSPSVKAILDRCIGLSTPLSTYRKGEMHHCLRYGMHDLLCVYVYGSCPEHEKKTFEYMAARNAVNYGFRRSLVSFAEDVLSLKGRMI